VNYRKSTSPANTGANWKSRQPTECDYCKRMFSNKFNLKQVIKVQKSFDNPVAQG